jgi:hypothetical protein
MWRLNLDFSRTLGHRIVSAIGKTLINRLRGGMKC